jgi:hypothetical protein
MDLAALENKTRAERCESILWQKLTLQGRSRRRLVREHSPTSTRVGRLEIQAIIFEADRYRRREVNREEEWVSEPSYNVLC